MVLSNADISSGKDAPPGNAAQGSAHNLAVMGIAGAVATQGAQLAPAALGLPGVLKQGYAGQGYVQKGAGATASQRGSKFYTGAGSGGDLC